MNEFLLFGLLGLGSGAAYAILGLGVVAVYKGSGILNFAQGAMAMFSVYCYAELTGSGVVPGLAAAIVVVGAAVGGALIFFAAIRPLRNAPALAKAVVTIGILSAFLGLAQIFWSSSYLNAPSILPNGLVSAFGASFGANNLYAVALTVVMAVALWALYRFTTFGRATRAASENERGVALLGFSPDLISAGNWAFGSACAALGGVIIGPIVGLDISTLTLMIVPAVAAALLGGFRSFGLTAVMGLLIGVAQAEINRFSTQPGLADAVPFVVVIVAMVFTGRLIPARGMLGLERPPFAPKTRVSPIKFLIGGSTLVILLTVVNDTYITALTNSMVVAIVGLSLVVVTGFLGQISLAQMAFAGSGAFTAAHLSSSLGMPFLWTILIAAIVGGALGVVIGLPALRVRGLSLAVVTLGFAEAIYAFVFSNPEWNNGSAVPTKSPSLWGFSLDPIVHPARFGFVVVLFLGATAFVVMNLRRSAFGQRMLAIRSNERSAAAAGINVTAVKLQGFVLAAAIAAVGGALGAYQLGSAANTSYTAFASITLLTLVYIGGIASTSGALIAGLICAGGVLLTLLSGVSSSLSNDWTLITGLLLVVTAITQPDGAAVANLTIYNVLRQRLKGRRGGHGQVEPPARRASGRADNGHFPSTSRVAEKLTDSAHERLGSYHHRSNQDGTRVRPGRGEK